MYLASDRPNGLGGLDIWVAHRPTADASFGAPVNPGEPVNSAADDLCPTPIRGGGLLFVSREALPGGCGMGEHLLHAVQPEARLERAGAPRLQAGRPQQRPRRAGPLLCRGRRTGLLYFSSGPDIYVSEKLENGSFSPAAPVAELNGAASDIQPNVRKDGRELAFASNDSGRPGARGGFDIYVTTRESVDDPWSVPVNSGDAMNTVNNETRPSFSWAAQTLYFGRAPGPEGSTNIYVTTRGSSRGPTA